jgi:hypothetical protein
MRPHRDFGAGNGRLEASSRLFQRRFGAAPAGGVGIRVEEKAGLGAQDRRRDRVVQHRQRAGFEHRFQQKRRLRRDPMHQQRRVRQARPQCAHAGEHGVRIARVAGQDQGEAVLAGVHQCFVEAARAHQFVAEFGGDAADRRVGRQPVAQEQYAAVVAILAGAIHGYSLSARIAAGNVAEDIIG